tara:strand:+ start:503 stop:1360 length:858 start_codon:yes stop_codon:yes gene_type:complete
MKLRTFYRIYFRHRIKKANFFLKIYLCFSLLIRYFINLFYFEKKVNLDECAKKNNYLFDKNIHYLFEYFNSDKGIKFIDQYPEPFKRRNRNEKVTAHGYSEFYEKYFNKLKNESINILEIGSFYGSASAGLYFYFKNANIYGADINPDMFKYKSNRIKSVYVDSGSRKSIDENIVEKKISFKIIIEDASHSLKDQILSLFILFKCLDPGGIFIVEELDFPEKREDMRINQSQPDLKQILKSALTDKDFSSEYINQDEKDYFLNNFESISFYKGNFNEMAVIKKKQ